MVNTICNQDRASLLWTSLPSCKMFNMKNGLSNKLDKKICEIYNEKLQKLWLATINQENPLDSNGMFNQQN